MLPLFVCLLVIPLWARVYISIDEATQKKFPIAIVNLIDIHDAGDYVETVPHLIQKDLEELPYFRFIPPEEFLEKPDNRDFLKREIDFDLWTKIGAKGLIKGRLEKLGSSVVLEFKLFDPFLKKLLLKKEYRGDEKDIRLMANLFVNEVLFALTGTR